MDKPWSLETFPTNKPVWIRKKLALGGCSMITTVGIQGAAWIIPDQNGKAATIGMSWNELHRTCVQHSGQPCGVKK